ncbi:hypothetical protein K438DRAFT_1986195 [Mycena galopus ATCC 62051]|nr:hypothetical protein K438DRAFT_1986195 [Mycena galopus ATCC 62051]
MDDDSRSVARLTPILPFKGQQTQPRDKIIRGLLSSRQDLTCDPGYGLCPNLPGFCCPAGGQCCSVGACCASGEYCVATGCCPDGETCDDTRTSKTPIGPIAGGIVGGVVLLAIGIFIFFRRRRNRPQPLPARDTGNLATPTPAEQKYGSESLYSPSPGQSVATLPSSTVIMSSRSGGGYSQHELLPAAPSYPTTISLTVPPNLHDSYSQPGVIYSGVPAAPATISSMGGTQSTNLLTGGTESTNSSAGGTQSTKLLTGGTESTNSSVGGTQSTKLLTGGTEFTNSSVGGTQSTNLSTGGTQSTNSSTGGTQFINSSTGGTQSTNSSTGGTQFINSSTGGT